MKGIYEDILMKDKDKNKSNINWRRLDNSAKIFPIISNKNFSTVFRISALLNDKIEPNILLNATNETLKKFDTFRVREKRGLFWYFFEENDKKIKIEKENDYPCKHIDKVSNNRYLFKVTYFENKINLDVFHSITDGGTAINFLRELLYNYLDEKYELNEQHEEFINDMQKQEDSYLKNYDKKAFKPEDKKKAYLIKKRNMPLGMIGVTHGFISVNELKNVSKKYNATITEYLVAQIIRAIEKTERQRLNKKRKGKFKRPIRVCIPINLKKYFDSKTLLNFFACTYIEKKFEDKLYRDDFEVVIKDIKKQFEDKINFEAIKTIIAQDVKLGNNFFIRILPLMLKRATIQLTYDEIRKYVTTTFSNVGIVKINPTYEKYIDNFFVLLAPEKSENIKCGACSYKDKFSITFTSVFEENNIEKEFFELLKQDGIKSEIDGNGVYDAIS